MQSGFGSATPDYLDHGDVIDLRVGAQDGFFNCL